MPVTPAHLRYLRFSLRFHEEVLLALQEFLKLMIERKFCLKWNCECPAMIAGDRDGLIPACRHGDGEDMFEWRRAKLRQPLETWDVSDVCYVLLHSNYEMLKTNWPSHIKSEQEFFLHLESVLKKAMQGQLDDGTHVRVVSELRNWKIGHTVKVQLSEQESKVTEGLLDAFMIHMRHQTQASFPKTDVTLMTGDQVATAQRQIANTFKQEEQRKLSRLTLLHAKQIKALERELSDSKKQATLGANQAKHIQEEKRKEIEHLRGQFDEERRLEEQKQSQSLEALQEEFQRQLNTMKDEQAAKNDMLAEHMRLLQDGLLAERVLEDARSSSSSGGAHSCAMSKTSTELPASLASSGMSNRVVEVKRLMGRPEQWCEVVELPGPRFSRAVMRQCSELVVRIGQPMLLFVGEWDPRREGALPLITVQQNGEPRLPTSVWKGCRVESLSLSDSVAVTDACSKGCVVVSPSSGKIVGSGLRLKVITSKTSLLGTKQLDLALQVTRSHPSIGFVGNGAGTLSIFSHGCSKQGAYWHYEERRNTPEPDSKLVTFSEFRNGLRSKAAGSPDEGLSEEQVRACWNSLEVAALRDGARVRLHSLQKGMELNGKIGTCKAFDQARGRWKVVLGNGEVKLVKPTNLEVDCTDDAVVSSLGKDDKPASAAARLSKVTSLERDADSIACGRSLAVSMEQQVKAFLSGDSSATVEEIAELACKMLQAKYVSGANAEMTKAIIMCDVLLARLKQVVGEGIPLADLASFIAQSRFRVGQVEDAQHNFRYARDVFAKHIDLHRYSVSSLALISVLSLQGHLDKARAVFQEAESWLIQRASPAERPHCMCQLLCAAAQMERGAGNITSAIGIYKRLAAISNGVEKANRLSAMATLSVEQGDSSQLCQAREALEEAWQLFSGHKWTPDCTYCEALFAALEAKAGDGRKAVQHAQNVQAALAGLQSDIRETCRINLNRAVVALKSFRSKKLVKQAAQIEDICRAL